MPSYTETAEDLAKKYHGTFVLYKGKPSYVSNFAQLAENTIACKISQSDTQGSHETIMVEQSQLEPLILDAAFVNNGDLTKKEGDKGWLSPAIFVARSPKRQWKRGMCQDNVRIWSPVNHLYRSFGKRFTAFDPHLSFRLIHRLLNPEYPSVQEAQQIVDKLFSAAISPMFAITVSNQSNNRYLLTSSFGFIGEVKGDTIFIHHQPALQEVRDFVRRTNQSISVEVVNA